jgi:hypothetical protein
LRAAYAFAFVARKFPGVECYLHPLLVEQFVVAYLPVCGHLLKVLVFYFRVQLASKGLGGFSRRDANGATGLEVDKGCCHLAPVTKLKGALAQPATGDDGDRIGCAAVYFDDRDQAFAIPAAWLLNAQAVASEHRQTDAQNLPCAKMSVDDPGFFEKIIESELRFQHTSMLDHFRRYGSGTRLWRAT